MVRYAPSRPGRSPHPWFFSSLFIVVVFVVGFLFGLGGVRSVDSEERELLTDDVLGLFQAVETGRLDEGDGMTIAVVADRVLKTVGLIWVLALSVIGAPLILAVVFYKGFVLGFTVGILVHDWMWRGIGVIVAAIVPQHLFDVPALLLAATCATWFSLNAFRAMVGRSDYSVGRAFLSMSGVASAAAALMVVAAGVEAWITPVLMEVAGRYLM